MGLHIVKKGLDLPISGEPDKRIEDGRATPTVALIAADYPGMKPGMFVAEGDSVRAGQLLFEDKKQPGVRFTSPGTGTVLAINRGAKRALQSVVVRLDDKDRGDGTDSISFAAFTSRHPGALSRTEVRDLLVESGLWTALRARPYGRVASPEATPHSIFVNAMDTQPLAPDLDAIYEGRESDMERGLSALARLTDGPVYLCRAPGSRIEAPREDRFRVEEFRGPHPAGTVGYHIHTLDPVTRGKLVWYAGLQDVLAIGRLFDTGKLDSRRVISVAGPSVLRPRLLRTRIGAATDPLVNGELRPPGKAFDPEHRPHGTGGGGLEPQRVISGSVLAGRQAHGPVHGFLGRYHQQVSVIPEGTRRELLGWLTPGLDRYSVSSLFLSKLTPGKRFAMSSSTNGSPRAIVPFGLYEKVMPMDLQPTFLLKALVMGDLERAEELGCLELEEEDLALCTFVCPGKNDYGLHLRKVLATLEKEG